MVNGFLRYCLSFTEEQKMYRIFHADLLSGTFCWIIVYMQISERYEPK